MGVDKPVWTSKSHKVSEFIGHYDKKLQFVEHKNGKQAIRTIS